MCSKILIASLDVQKLKQRARKLKRESGVTHHEALDQIAKAVGFDHWHHVSESAKAFAPTESAYFFGVIIAMDIKDADGFHDPSGRFVEDHMVFTLCANDIYAYAREADGDGEVDTDDPEYKRDLEEWGMDIIMNYVFYRYTGIDTPASVEDVVALVRECCFWPPELIWHKGVFQESPSDEALDEDGQTVGIRFAL